MNTRMLVAFLVGTALFSVLPHYSFPLAVEGPWGAPAFRAYANWVFVLGFGGAALIGAVLVLIARDPSGITLCPVCPFVGGFVYTLVFVAPQSGFDPLIAILCFIQFLFPAMAGGWLMSLTIGSGSNDPSDTAESRRPA